MDICDHRDYELFETRSRGGFRRRTALAVELLLKDLANGRPFDNCFEQGDGTAVVLAVALAARERAERGDHRLARAIEGRGSLNPPLLWREFPERFRHVRDLEAFAAACLRSGGECGFNQMTLNLD